MPITYVKKKKITAQGVLPRWQRSELACIEALLELTLLGFNKIYSVIIYSFQNKSFQTYITFFHERKEIHCHLIFCGW